MQTKKIKILLLLSILSFFVLPVRAALTKHDPLIAAIIHVESGGNDMAIGDRGKHEMAYGALQIRKPCVDDVNRRFGTKYQAKDMLGNRALSVWVCQKYIETYAAPKWLGREPTLEDKARIWNGGPSGWKKASTNGYWAKVQKAMTRNEMLAAAVK
jgi:hypothetical protein